MKNELIESDNYNEKELGEVLDELRILRNEASYDKNGFEDNYFENSLTEIKKDIEKGLQSLKFLNKNPPINRWSK